MGNRTKFVKLRIIYYSKVEIDIEKKRFAFNKKKKTYL